ncbi:unnamed protein product [Amoebophrya sp. A120]|nr:unnamed protein product [Amoebophrya sp. A120]|eukprot:GSA120T00002176001.1
MSQREDVLRRRAGAGDQGSARGKKPGSSTSSTLRPARISAATVRPSAATPGSEVEYYPAVGTLAPTGRNNDGGIAQQDDAEFKGSSTLVSTTRGSFVVPASSASRDEDGIKKIKGAASPATSTSTLRPVQFVGLVILVVVARLLDAFFTKKAFAKWGSVLRNDDVPPGMDFDATDRQTLQIIEDKAQDYSLFANNMINLFYFTVFGFFVYPRRWFPQLFPEAWRLREEVRRQIPIWVFAVLAGLDAMANLANALGQRTPGTVQPLLDQIGLPFIMLLTYVFLKERFVAFQYVGALLLICGAALSVFGRGLNNLGEDADDGGSSSQLSGSSLATFIIIYLFKPLFYSASYTMKEANLRHLQNVDLWYMSQWINFFQLVFTIPLMLFAAVPFLNANPIPVSEVFPLIPKGAECFVGRGEASRFCSEQNLGLWLTMQALVNVSSTTLQLFLVKHAGAATMSTVAMGVAVPLVTTMFYCIAWETPSFYSVRQIWVGFGSPKAAWDLNSYYILLAIAFTSTGFVLYSLAKKKKSTPASKVASKRTSSTKTQSALGEYLPSSAELTSQEPLIDNRTQEKV